MFDQIHSTLSVETNTQDDYMPNTDSGNMYQQIHLVSIEFPALKGL